MSLYLPEELTESVYRAALEPDTWPDVMRLIDGRFPSTAQTFYFLELAPHRVRPVSLVGIEPGWVHTFNALYFAPDNPWIRLTRSLHRPGVVRTNERLDAYLGEAGVLYRSAYYNDWMRPQRFRTTMGSTLLAEDGLVANVTLFRPPDMPTFSDAEVGAFEQLSRHMTRSLQMALRLEQPHKDSASTAALDALPQAVAMIDAQRRVHYANATMEALLRRRDGLVLRGGALDATHEASRQHFEKYIADALCVARRDSPGTAALTLPTGDRRHLSVRAIPFMPAKGPVLPLRPVALLMATECLGHQSVPCEALRKLYGCTPAEARLTQGLVDGQGLRQAASRLGVTYETARAYLKVVFQKTGVHTQAQLVAKVLGDCAAPTRTNAGH